ncbi:recombinase family protein [Methylobacterium sp. J-068]|uniref:recombinase family protein n=1 Tax=Methylobacterium sp. J-068 TaxID=2836649 RepID=UPI001FB9F6EF|nr:recombinase family protein [Methylobacterium sp. J-068]MCJ2033175.1 recombinase family protein [Methylobacterium sp. J-068]
MTTFVAYLRVSTDKQGRSGLGLDAQRAAIGAFLRPDDTLLEPPYVEVESGKRTDRPQLRAALDRCQRTGATLLIAKLDRLSRDAHFLLGLQKAGVRFLAADMPEANEMVVGILAVVAQAERKMISDRTKAALAAAKARGQKLGGDRGYRPASPPSADDTARATAARRREADHAAFGVLPAIERLRREGITSLTGLAARLNSDGVASPRGKVGSWTATAVRRALVRVA